jgi:hypothetical protein
MAMHGKHMESQPPMGLKGDSGEGDVRSYQVPSKVQNEAGYTCEGELSPYASHGDAWGS